MNPKLTIRKFFVEVTAALLVLLFFYTALSKLSNTYSFTGSLKHHRLLAPMASLLSVCIPLAEIVVVLAISIPRTRRTGLLMATLLLATFSLYIGYLLVTASTFPCTCGGILEHLSWREHFVFNLTMTFISFAAFLFYPNVLSRSNRRCRIPEDIVGNFNSQLNQKL